MPALLVLSYTIKGNKATCLIDSGATENFIGATENFISAGWLQARGLPITPAAQAQAVYTTDGRQQPLIGNARLQLCCGTYAASIKAQVVELGRHHQLILGYAWLTAVNPRIDFRRGLVRIAEHGQTHVLTPAATRRVTSDSMGYLSATQAKRALQKEQSAYVVYVNAFVSEPGQPLELPESDTQKRHVPETGVQKHAEPVSTGA
jgi:hypothetical protein